MKTHDLRNLINSEEYENFKKEGLTYKFKVVGRESIFYVKIPVTILEVWHSIVTNRFIEMSKLTNEEMKQNYMLENPVFDVDESYECSLMSTEHLLALTRYFALKWERDVFIPITLEEFNN